MSLTEENGVLDHTLLLHNDHDDHDILNEFLDQRVFDSMNANTPVASSALLNDDFQGDLFLKLKTDADPDSLFLKMKTEPLDEFMPDLSMYKLKAEPEPYLPNSDHEMFAQFDSNNNSPEQSYYGNAQYDSASGYSPKDKSTLDDYDDVRRELSKVKFGNFNMNPCPPSIDVPDASYLDFSKEAMLALPYSLKIYDLPSYSRVETQIKLNFLFSPPPQHSLLHIPQDLISKNKFCLQDPVSSLPAQLRENMLFMDTYVLTADLKRSCNICSRCIKREQKRALRSKTGANETSSADSPSSSAAGLIKNNPNSWSDEKMIKKAIIFNCKEIVSFPAPSGLSNDLAKNLELSARIICYCRHHKELDGFKLLFVVKDHNDKVVAKLLSSTIMIMDRKKNASSVSIKETASASRQSARSATDEVQDELFNPMHPLSPNSIDDSTSDALANTDNTDSNVVSRKRKKLSFDDSYNNSTNPMFNGGSGFSPLSNSDTNTSIHNMNGKNGLPTQPFGIPNFAQPLPLPRQRLQLLLHMLQLSTQQPSIQKIIPAQGPIRGGIEVTLLGFNFRPGLTVKFGSKNALATHCWSESTIVTYLPPAAQPGQVLVSFEQHENVMSQQLVFTYIDDTDRQLIELALQIVGLKMNGKLEDAKNIAKRIVGSDASQNGTNSNSPAATPGMNQAMEWYDNAHKAVEKLSRSDLSTAEILINFLSLVDLPNCPIIIPNWQLCNNQGQTLLHLATLKNYSLLIKFLITHGCKIDIKDNQGLTPLFIASMCGHRELIKIFIECKSNWNLKLSNDKVLKDYCDLNVLDIFNKLEADSYVSDETSSLHHSGKDAEDSLTKSYSVDSLNSLYQMDYGKHISKMVMDSTTIEEKSEKCEVKAASTVSQDIPESPRYANDSEDFADSEFDSDDNFSDDARGYTVFENDADEEDDYDEDYEDYESSDNELGETAAREGSSSVAEANQTPREGLWQKVKNAVFISSEAEAELPSYDDLFPFGPSFNFKPKSQVERQLNEEPTTLSGEKSISAGQADPQEDAGLSSDSSEDMVISYLNHPRKTVENDKMLLFFWFPVLVLIIGLSLYMSITGYQVEMIEKFKEVGRNAIGNMVVGNERLARVFKNAEHRLTV